MGEIPKGVRRVVKRDCPIWAEHAVEAILKTVLALPAPDLLALAAALAGPDYVVVPKELNDG